MQQICSPLQQKSVCSLAAAAAGLGGSISSLPGSKPSSRDKAWQWELWKSHTGRLGLSLPASLGSGAVYSFRGAFTWESRMEHLNSQGQALQRVWTRRAEF